MATAFSVGEIKMFAGNFAPSGWMFCSGQLLPISEFEVLFNPGLEPLTAGMDKAPSHCRICRGRLPLHMGGGFTLAQTGGSENVTLTTGQMPNHGHGFLASTDTGGQSNPAGMVPASSNVISIYKGVTPGDAMDPGAILKDGGNQPHSNLQPFLCVDFIISLFGVFQNHQHKLFPIPG